MYESKPDFNNSINDRSKNIKSIYILGISAIIISILVGMVDIIITFFPGGGFEESKTVAQWFLQLQNNPVIALRNLDLPYLIIIPLGIIIFYTLYIAHRRVNKVYAGLAVLIYLLGAAVFVSGIKALPMLELSNQYMSSVSEEQKLLILAAGKTLLTAGESHSLSNFMGVLLGDISGILMCTVMLRGKIFNKLTGLTGIAGFSCLLFYLLAKVFIPVLIGIGEIIVMFGGLLSLAWYVLVSIRFFQLSRNGESGSSM